MLLGLEFLNGRRRHGNHESCFFKLSDCNETSQELSLGCADVHSSWICLRDFVVRRTLIEIGKYSDGDIFFLQFITM